MFKFKKFIEDFSDYIHSTYYPAIPKDDWKITNRYGDHYVFGYKPEEYFYGKQTPPHMIAFQVRYVDEIIVFHVYREYPSDKKIIPTVLDDFVEQLEEKKFNVLINCIYGITSRLVKDSKVPFYPIGEKYKKISELLTYFADHKNYQLNAWNSISLTHKRTTNRAHYTLTPSKKNAASILIEDRQKQEKTVVSSKAEVDAFFANIEKGMQELVDKENEIVDMIKKIDITCYYDRNNSSLYIYNERVPFHIGKIVEGGKQKYRIRFNSGYNKSQSLDDVMEKVKKKINDYVKKSRVKAAVGGNAFDVFHKFVYKTLGHQVNNFSFSKYFDTRMSEGELNLKLRNFIDDEVEKLSKAHKDFFQMYVRQKGNRHRIKKAVKLGDLYTFVSATKLFVVTETEFKNIQLNESSFTKREDREEVKKLQDWKEKQLSII